MNKFLLLLLLSFIFCVMGCGRLLSYTHGYIDGPYRGVRVDVERVTQGRWIFILDVPLCFVIDTAMLPIDIYNLK